MLNDDDIIRIDEYIPEIHANWIHKNDLNIFNNPNYHKPNRFSREIYNVLNGWVIYINNDIVGSCLYNKENTMSFDVNAKPHWYFAYLGILPNHQKKGLGELLLQKLVEIADYQKIYLTCNSGNPCAIKLYQKYGFIIDQKNGFIHSTGSQMILKRSPI